MDVADERQQSGRPHRLQEAELVSRPQRVGEVAARVRKRKDLRPGALRLQEIGCEVRRGERYADRAYDLPLT